MSIKLMEKICDGCGHPRYIWKNDGGKRYCKICWGKHQSKIKPMVKKTYAIPKRSSKQAKLDAVYKVARDLYLKEHPMCEAHLTKCSEYSTQVHHKAGRGEYLLDQSTWLAVCFECHVYIEQQPKVAKALGFSVERLKTTKDENIK